MNLSKLAIKRPVACIMLTLVVILVGTVSLFGLPRDLMPKMEFPVALVMVQYPNATPEEVETMITKPLEQSLATVEGLDQIVSMTSQGTSVVLVQFQMNVDMNFATLNMREKISLISDLLPSEASAPTVMKMDMNATPVMQVYVSGDVPLAELNKTIDDNLLSYFERTAGVASVNVYGGVTEEVSVAFDQERLSGYGLTLSQIGQMLSAENINLPSGDVLNGSNEVIVRTLGEFESIDDIKNLPIPLKDRSILRLSDIATIEKQYKDQTSISRVDGKTSIAITITKQSDANTVNVSDSIKKEISKLEKQYPDLNFVVGFDQADFINSSINSVAEAAVTGAILAIIVIFLFLRNVSTTMIIAISIPTSLLATFALMSLRGMSLNLITLCALTLAVGMLVDNSVVVLENIFRTRQSSDSAEDAALHGSNEILTAVVASTLTSIVVYLPIAMSNGISALMFRDFCYTIIIALVASLVVSLTVVPMLASRILSHNVSMDYIRVGTHHYRFKLLPKFTQFIDWVTDSYGNFIAHSLTIKKRVLAACIGLFVLSCSLVGVIGMELLPASDEGTFTVSVTSPYGTSLQDKDRLMTQLESYLLALPELKHCT
ncbi:MAG: efflux RND transporter permease subunit, partial [Anaerovorax sp.]